MTRRKNGQASVEEHPKGSGAYRVRARVRDDRTGKSRLATIASGVPRAEADELADAYTEVRNTSVLREGLTLEQFGKGFLDRRERSGVRGIRTDRNRWKNHITADELGGTLLSTIGRRDILDWVDRRKGKHQTRKNVLNLLRVALQEALDRELIATNPARDVRLHAARSMSEDDLEGILNPAEQQRLLAAVPEGSRPMVVFALLTGVRQAEQWWLKPEDVSRSSVIIRRSSRGKAPKNGKNRTVFLLEPAQRALELAPRDRDSDWVWPAIQGGRRAEGKAPRGWHRWVKAAKLRRRVRWHDLRHTCATSLLAGWWGRKWSLDEVCQMLGHSSVKVTERYARKLAETMRLAVAETLFPKSSPLLLPEIAKTAGKMRSRFRDLNSRPAVYETAALPLS